MLKTSRGYLTCWVSSHANADLEGGWQTWSSTCLHLSIYMVGKWVDATICPCIDSGPLGLPLLMDVTSCCCRAMNKAYKEANYGCHWKTQLHIVVSLHSQRWVLQTVHQIVRTWRNDEAEEHDHEDHGEMSRCDNRGEVRDVPGVLFKSGTKIWFNTRIIDWCIHHLYI